MQISFEKWFNITVIASASVIVVYVISHIFGAIEGYKIVKLNSDQVSTVNLIINTNETVGVTYGDSTERLLYFYLNNQLNRVGDSTVATDIDSLIGSHSLRELSVVLPQANFKVKSFFWLSGNLVYLELLFWIWFGLIASVIYTGIQEKISGKFNKDYIYDHIGKFVYGTIVAVLLYLATDALTSNNLLVISDISYGSIVFVFILGFFHTRAIELLNRLKEVLIPVGKPQPVKSGSIVAHLKNVPQNQSFLLELVNEKNGRKVIEKFSVDQNIEVEGLPFGKYNLNISGDSSNATMLPLKHQVELKKQNPNGTETKLNIDFAKNIIEEVK